MWTVVLHASDTLTLPGGEALSWFPQEYAGEFYVVKGVLALIATVMVVFHMAKTWDWVDNWGQRLRYLALFYLTGLVTYSSTEQIRQDELVNLRNIGGMIGAVVVIVAMAVSIKHDYDRLRS